MVEPVLSVRNLSIDVLTEAGWTSAVDDVTFDIGRGATLGLVGESGSGKTLTSLAVMGLLDPRSVRVRSGSALLRGVDVTTMRERELQDIRGSVVSMIFQEPMTSLNPAFTVGEQIAESARRHLSLSRRAAWQRAVDFLSAVKIPNAARAARSFPHEFSGGMRQRAMIALALCCHPDLLIADEPTTALDVTVQAQILDLILDLQRELEMSMLFVTHDLSVIAAVADEVVVMYAGQVVEHGNVFDVFDAPKHPYSRGLLKSTPTGTSGDTELYSISGSPPPLGGHGGGCRFADRCEFAVDECRAAPVELDTFPDGRSARCIRIPALDRHECWAGS